MLEVTFLGHQGWQFAAGDMRILVDPLLVEPFGHGGGVGRVYPPRKLDIAAMPPVDAVILTHEHEDHFNIPSINRLSRGIPVYVPERSSIALRQFLAEAGFEVFTLAAGNTLDMGDLHFTCFSPDHLRHDELDEWETMPFLVTDVKDGGSFFTTVDVAVSAGIEAQLRQRGVTPGLWCYANNSMNMSFQEQPLRRPPAVLPIAARFIADHAGRPSPRLATVMCGGGFSFDGARAWLNQLFFPLDSDKLFDGLGKVSADATFHAPMPGAQYIIDKECIRSTTDNTPWLAAAPRDQWPDRTYDPRTEPAKVLDTATGGRALEAAELQELEERLGDFASFLYGGALFRALYSLTVTALPPPVKATFAIGVISGETRHVFEYDPSGCRFVRIEKPGPLSAYVAALECHAADLLAYLRCEIMPSALMFGRVRRWRGGNENFTSAIDQAIWLYAHPLRRPTSYLALYRSLYALEPKDTPKVRGRPAG
ncbi:MAG: MBL fold metallo-hydrolase [Alphaproteobacteria bacterium]